MLLALSIGEPEEESWLIDCFFNKSNWSAVFACCLLRCSHNQPRETIHEMNESSGERSERDSQRQLNNHSFLFKEMIVCWRAMEPIN